MGGILPDRVAQLREQLGLSQTGLGSLIGTSQASIQRIESGETLHPRKLLQLANALRTTPEYLTGETDQPDPSRLSDRQSAYRGFPESASTVEVAELDLAYGMGGTFLDDMPVQSEPMQFARSWLRKFTSAPPENLFFAQGAGDSMAPTILDSDIVLIDRSQDTIRMSDKIWAVAFGSVGMIKRLRPLPDGSVAILSDNPQVPEVRAVDDEMHVIGRVVAVVRRI